MQNKNMGYPINHVKDVETADAFVVMVVIARRIMRNLLIGQWKKKEAEMRTERKSDIEIEVMKGRYTLTKKLGPFSPLGQAYTSNQLRDLFQVCGAYAMGLPYYSTHVLRSMHATGVAKWCIKQGLAQDHPATLRIFNAARHGDEERIRAYTLVCSDAPNRDGIEHTLRSVRSTNQALEKGGTVCAGGGANEPDADFESFQKEFGLLRIGVDGLRTVNNRVSKVTDVHRAQALLLKRLVDEGGVGEVSVMDIAGKDGGLGATNLVKRKVSEAPEGAVEQLKRRPTMKYAQGKKMQGKDDRRKKMIVEMNRLFLEWARLFREENVSAKDGSAEALTLATIKRSKSISVVFASSIRPEMGKMGEHREFFDQFFGEFSGKTTCDRTAKKLVTWENPPE